MNEIENINKALNKALYQFGTDNGIAIALENQSFTPDDKQEYLASFLLSSGMNSADIGVSDWRNGLYQIDINVQQNSGKSRTNKIADMLNQLFFAGSTFNKNDICVYVESFDPPQNTNVQNGWATSSITITWNSYTAKIG